MRILFLFNGYRRPDDRTRIDFLRKLDRFDDVELMMYGPNEHEIDIDFAPIPYSDRIKLSNFLDVAKPDILFLILYSAGAYDISALGIDNVPIKLVVLEEDHYFNHISEDRKVLDWYDNNAAFDLILRRHHYVYGKERVIKPETVWFPFSGNEEEFFCNNTNRRNKIGFVGSLTEDVTYYDIRRKAVSELLRYRYIEDGNMYLESKAYAGFLREYRGFLSCNGGTLYTPMAKMFEAMLSKTAVLSNKLFFNDILFDNEECFFEYKDDCSDIIEKTNIILRDNYVVDEIIDRAYKKVLKYHTDSKRIIELYNILKALIEERRVPKIWGQ